MNTALPKLPKLTTLAFALTIGAGTCATTAFAQDQNTQPVTNPAQGNGMPMQTRDPARGGFPLLGLSCAPDAAERMEAAFANTEERLDLSDEQQAALDDFQTAALNAQTSMSNTCAGFANVDAETDTTPDLVDRLTQRQVMLTAQVDAMDNVLPALETFYDSLTDAQKADLMPRRDHMNGQRDGFRNGGHQGQHSGKHDGDRNGHGEHGPRGDRPAPAPQADAPEAEVPAAE